MPGKFERPRGAQAPQPRKEVKNPTAAPSPAPRPKRPAASDMPPVRRESAAPRAVRQAPPQKPPRKRKKKGFPFGSLILVLLILILLGALGFMGWKIYGFMTKNASGAQVSKPSSSSIFSKPTEEPTTEPTEPETTLPVPEHVVSTASIGSMGDLLMHKPVIDTGLQSDGSYDFTNIFKYLTGDLAKNDVNVANLETTLAGTSKPYAGFPMFNCPDALAEYAQKAGFGMLLTSNNHCYDTSWQGYSRTLEVTHGLGIETLGTMLTPEDPKYLIKEINGINVGMISYTYETSDGSGKYPALNGLPMYDGSYDIINTFVPNAPQKMYDEVSTYIAQMKEKGADAIVMYIHWGIEYLLYANDNQKAIAQNLCDLGVDVIIGGHPHVVEPMALLESTVDPNHKTVCIYSLGNAVSNQRLGNLSMISTAHTEDGVLFNISFEKYSDGTVYLASVDAVPTWVNLRTSGPREYNILPLVDSRRESWREDYDLNDTMMSSCEKSYTRTMELVGEGLSQCQSYLERQKAAREAYYYDLAFFPEKFETKETVPEATVEIPAETEILPAA